MNEININGKLVRFQNAVSDIAVSNLRNTLRIIPLEHIQRIRQIDVLSPSRFGHGPDYAGGGSGVGYPRLSELCFDRSKRPNNFPINLTLLHEVGHVMDQLYQCWASLAPEHQLTLQQQIRIPPEGRSHGIGEYYAIAYQTVLTCGASEAVRTAVLSSTAFSGVEPYSYLI